jgi:hypothetical protein
MARPSGNTLALIVYVLLLAVGGVAAKSWHEAKVKRAIFTNFFRVSAPPTGAPGDHVSIEFDSYRMGEYDILEIGNLRLATMVSRRRYGSSGSGNFSSRIPDPSDPNSRDTFSTELSNIPIIITNCEVTFGETAYSVIGSKHLLIIDRQGHVVSETPLEE